MASPPEWNRPILKSVLAEQGIGFVKDCMLIMLR